MSDGRILGIFSAPGGVGKTTITICLGWFLRRFGLKVLLVDLDPSISLSLLFFKEEKLIELERRKKTLSSAIDELLEKKTIDEIEKYLHMSKFYDSEIDVVVPDMRFPDTIDRVWYGPRARREYILKDLLDSLKVRENYDITIVDTIPFFDKKYTTITIYASDAYLIPLRPTLIDVYRTTRMLKELPQLTGIDENKLYSKIGLIFNMVATSKQRRMIEAYRDILARKISPHIYVFNNYLPNRVSFSRIGTEEATRQDIRIVEEVFGKFLEEFKEWFSNVADAEHLFLGPEEKVAKIVQTMKKLEKIIR